MGAPSLKTSLVIRQAGLQDWESLSRLIAECAAEHSGFNGVNDAQLAHDGILHGVRTGEAVFVAEEGGVPVGYVAWVHFPLSPEGHVSGLGTFVSRDFRRQGISKKLRDAAVQHCKRKGYSRIEGVAHVDNDAGLSSSIDKGFKIVGYLVSKEI
jgi:GNAT superfamily N-acetyltransferase